MLKKFSTANIGFQIFILFGVLSLLFILPEKSIKLIDINNIYSTDIGDALNTFFSYSKVFTLISVAFLLLANAFYFNYILLKFNLSQSYSLLPALLIIILGFFLPINNITCTFFIISLLLLFAICNILKSYNSEYAKILTLNAAISISLTAIIFPYFIIFALFLFLALFTQRVNLFRIWLIAIIGLILPLFYYSIFNAFTHGFNFLIVKKIYNFFVYFTFEKIVLNKITILYYAVLSIWLLKNILQLNKYQYDNIVELKKRKIILNYFGIFSLIIALLSNINFNNAIFISFFTIVALISLNIVKSKNTIYDDLFLITLFIINLIDRFLYA